MRKTFQEFLESFKSHIRKRRQHETIFEDGKMRISTYKKGRRTHHLPDAEPNEEELKALENS